MLNRDKTLPIRKLFQIIKRYIRQSALNFQKYYGRDQNIRVVGWGPRAKGRIIGLRARGQRNVIALLCNLNDLQL